jgi:hypothetical protein
MGPTVAEKNEKRILFLINFSVDLAVSGMTKSVNIPELLRFAYIFCLVGFEVFTAVYLKSIFFWDMTPCSALSGTRRFGGTYRLHLQGRRIVQQSSEQASGKRSLPAEDRYI